ncbi:MAG: hypothetical protein AAF790_07930 [Planctomycetota bacterium]
MNLLRRLHRWGRTTLLDVALAAYAVLMAVVWGVLAVTTGQTPWERGTEPHGLLVPFLASAALAYGFFRVFYFCPTEHPAYGRWLRQTPWRHPLPLPLGPVRLCPQDAVFLALVAATLPIDSPARVVLPLAAFAAGYAGLAWRVAVVHREHAGGYGLPAIAGLAVPAWFAEGWWPLAAVAVAALAATQFSLERCLSRFGGVPPEDFQPLFGSRETKQAAAAQPAAGPVATQLLGDTAETLWPPGHAAATGVLAAWLVFLPAHQVAVWFDGVTLDAAVTRQVFLSIHAFSAIPWTAPAVLRLLRYFTPFAPPISLLGRVATGRLIVPRFDYAAVPVLAAVVIGGCLPALLVSLGTPLGLAYALPAGLATAAVLGVPPSLTDWRHTGHHRLRTRRA